jgi:hypothetical protein
MPTSSSVGSSESNTNSSRSILSFIDTTFQHQYLPNFNSPKESSTADVEKSSFGQDKPSSSRNKASPSSNFSNSTKAKDAEELLRHVSRLYKVSEHVLAQNEQQKMVQVVQTLAMVYSVCGALDKKFGNTSAYKGRKSEKHCQESIQG